MIVVQILGNLQEFPDIRCFLFVVDAQQDVGAKPSTQHSLDCCPTPLICLIIRMYRSGFQTSTCGQKPLCCRTQVFSMLCIGKLRSLTGGDQSDASDVPCGFVGGR